MVLLLWQQGTTELIPIWVLTAQWGQVVQGSGAGVFRRSTNSKHTLLCESVATEFQYLSHWHIVRCLIRYFWIAGFWK